MSWWLSGDSWQHSNSALKVKKRDKIRKTGGATGKKISKCLQCLNYIEIFVKLYKT